MLKARCNAPATIGACQRRLPCIRAQATATHTRPQAAAGQLGTSNVLSIIPWAINNRIQFAKIKPVLLNDSGRGVIATYDINSNDCICSVPAKAALRTHPGCRSTFEVPADVWRQLPWFAQLALILLAEVVQGRSSKFAEYLAVLPKEVDVPVLWSEADIQQLKCSYFIQQVQKQQQEWTALAQQLDVYLAPAGLSQQQLFWALAVARSRAFAAPYAAAPVSTAPKIFAAAQVIAAATWLAQGPNGALGVEVLGAAAAAAVGYMLLQQLKTQQQHVMCPLLDMFNHDGGEQSECELDIWTDAFRVVSSRQWRQGEQVFISYGQSSSDALLQWYGFVEGNTKHERYLVHALPDALQQQGWTANKEQHSLLREVAFTQQGVPASAAAALEQVCKQPVGSSNTGPTGLTQYTTLSSTAKSLCAAALTVELQQLGVNMADDQLVLQASRELPRKQQELVSLQAELSKKEQQLQQLQHQLEAARAEQEKEEQHQQQPQVQCEVVQAEALNRMTAEETSNNETSECNSTRRAAKLEQAVHDVAASLHELQQQVQQLQHLLIDWQGRLHRCKLLAVQFRCEKQQVLVDILAQIRS